MDPPASPAAAVKAPKRARPTAKDTMMPAGRVETTAPAEESHMSGSRGSQAEGTESGRGPPAAAAAAAEKPEGQKKKKKRQRFSSPPVVVPEMMVKTRSTRRSGGPPQQDDDQPSSSALAPTYTTVAASNAAVLCSNPDGSDLTQLEWELLTKGFVVVRGGLSGEEADELLTVQDQDPGVWVGIMGENRFHNKNTGRDMKRVVLEENRAVVQRILAPKLRAWLSSWGVARRQAGGRQSQREGGRRAGQWELKDTCFLRTTEQAKWDQHRHLDYGNQSFPQPTQMSLSLIAGLKEGNSLNVWELGSEAGKCVCQTDNRGSCCPPPPTHVLRYGRTDLVILRGDLLHGGVRRGEAVGADLLERLHVNIQFGTLKHSYNRLGIA